MDAVRRAAASDSVLPSVFERNCGYAARGKLLFDRPVFNETHVAAQEEPALRMLQVFDASLIARELVLNPVGRTTIIWLARHRCTPAKTS